MRHRIRKLKIESWEEGPGLVIAVGRKNSEPRIHPGFSIRFGDDEAILSRTLKPVGFYIAYSYTLFRKGDDPRDPLYALF